MRTTNFAFSLATTLTTLALSACASPESEYIRALPDRATVLVAVPEGSSARALAPATRTSPSAIVGEPADLYTSTYYSARNLNAVVGFMVTLLETITQYPPTGIDDEHAVWGPFSDAREPNELILNIVKKKNGDATHYEWFIAGKHKSAGVDAYSAIAGGAFAPDGEDYGRGWFGIDFDAIHALNPSEQGRGKIGFAFARTNEGTAVLAHYEGPGDTGGAMDIAASYAYGEDNAGNGFVVFAFPGDIDNGKDGRTAIEDVLIRTRWNTKGGRADILAANGDLGAELAQGSQCWDETFISTFESINVGDRVLASSGEASTCAFEAAKLPEQRELPSAGDVANPYGAE